MSGRQPRTTRPATRFPYTTLFRSCAASSQAIGLARMMINAGIADGMVVGGAEKVATPLTIAAHAAMRALSQRNDDPGRASRPWDRNRDGFVLGDGGAVPVLESEAHARRLGARIHADLAWKRGVPGTRH